MLVIKIHLKCDKKHLGEVAERLKALVLKTSKGATLSWVRIPPSPPQYYNLNSLNFLDTLVTGTEFSSL